MDAQETTFNDLPVIIGNLASKIEKIENLLLSVNEQLKKNKSETEHIPMNLKEACEFLKVKRGTMYYYLEKRLIPATRSGKSYLFFKDELIRWAESSHNNVQVQTPEELHAEIVKNSRKRTGNRRELPG